MPRRELLETIQQLVFPQKTTPGWAIEKHPWKDEEQFPPTLPMFNLCCFDSKSLTTKLSGERRWKGMKPNLNNVFVPLFMLCWLSTSDFLVISLNSLTTLVVFLSHPTDKPNSDIFRRVRWCPVLFSQPGTGSWTFNPS